MNDTNKEGLKSSNFYMIVSVIAVVVLIVVFFIVFALLGGSKKNDSKGGKSLLNPAISDKVVENPNDDSTPLPVIEPTPEPVVIDPAQDQTQTTNPTSTEQTPTQQTPTQQTPTQQTPTQQTPTQQTPTEQTPVQDQTPTPDDVQPPQNNIGWIRFNLPKTTCIEGEKITGLVETGEATNGSIVANFSSNKEYIAFIERSKTQYSGSSSSVYVDITCGEQGVATLIADSSTGAITQTDINVRGYLVLNGSRNAVIHCRPDETKSINAKILNSNDMYVFSSYRSNRKAVVEIYDDDGRQGPTNSRRYQIRCKSEGEANITVSLESGSSVTATVRVEE